MNPSTRRRFQLLAVVGTLFLTLGAGPRDIGGGTARNSGLKVQSVTVQGNAVSVVVVNTATTTLAGTITVRPNPPLLVAPISVPVIVPAGGRVTVVVYFPLPVLSGVTVGVVLDDGGPF